MKWGKKFYTVAFLNVSIQGFHKIMLKTKVVKFVFSKKATKIDEIFTVDLTLTT